MKHQRVNLLALLASDQPRPLMTEAVDRLAASIKEVGLIQPVTVRPRAVMAGGLFEAGFQIIAGHHRVAACRALGWTEIDAIVIDSAERLTDELIEIDENLCRSELTASQRSSYSKRRKVIWEALHPVPSQKFERVWDALPIETQPQGELEGLGVVEGPMTEAEEQEEIQVEQVVPPVIGYGKPPPQTKSFAAETAAVTGMTKQAINRHIARADALGDDIDRLVGTSLDKGVELDALMKLPEPERKELIERAAAGEVVTARAAPTPHPQPASESPADFMQRYAFEMRLALDSAMCALGCKTNSEMARKVARGIEEAEREQLVLLDSVLLDLQAIVQMRA